MARRDITPTGREIRFADEDVIVSKTDVHGKITYVNDVFLAVSGYDRGELIGAPHSIIRHPDMPRCVFKVLWDTIQARQEIFAYVLNMARNGDHYWVFAHVTPSYDASGGHVGYHSNRRLPYPDGVSRVRPLYAELVAAERAPSNRETGLDAALRLVTQTLERQRMDWSQFVFSLSEGTKLHATAA